MRVQMWTSVLLVLFRCVAVVASHRVYDNLTFTADKCKELGYSNDFEVCAVIEFCSSQNARLSRHRHMRQLTTTDTTEEINEEFESEVEEAQFETEEEGFNEAAYGYRIEGSTKCSWPGPIMRLTRGKNHGLFLKGGNEATNLHFHGLHMTALGNGDSLDRSVEGEDNMLIYGIDLPADKHLGGTHWYHSHLKGSSWTQAKGGAFGMIVVDDNGHDVGTSDADVLKFLNNEKILVIENTQYMYYGNGLPGENFNFVQNEWYRLRILSVDVDSHHSLVAVLFDDNCDVYPIAHDGIFRFQVPANEKISSFTMTPSSRLDVAIRCSSDAGISVNKDVVANIHIDSSEQPSSATPYEGGSNSWSSKRLEYTKDLLSANIDNSLTVKVGETNINDINTNSGEPLCAEDGSDFSYGSVQSWNLKGINTHPFHVHMYPMQIETEGCAPHEVGEFYDSILAPHNSRRNPCVVRLYMHDVAGPTTLHCHIFLHAEQGALAQLYVADGPTTPSGPTCVGTCVDSKEMTKCSEYEMRLRNLRGM